MSAELPLPKLETVDLDQGYVVIEGGQLLPIVAYLDDDGDLCEPDEAANVMAGTAEYGWLCIALNPEEVSLH